jgi:hypothetical protein
MAAIMASAPTTPAVFTARSSFTGAALQSRSVRLPAIRQRLTVRSEAKDPISSAFEATKNTVTKADVEKNMAQNESEKQSVFGSVPASGSLPRPESERRPETGERTFGSIMAFDGPGPETINGRLAMTGFVWALCAEALTHKTIWQQITEPYNTGFFWLVAATNIIIFASLVPIFNGESPDSRSNGPFNGQAERWNGRLAMIGYAGLLIYEFAAQRSLL